MLPYFFIYENLPTFLLKNVGKTFLNLKNVQHRQDSTRRGKHFAAVSTGFDMLRARPAHSRYHHRGQSPIALCSSIPR
jgi:hypothetical protein